MKLYFYEERSNPSTDFYIVPLARFKNLSLEKWNPHLVPEENSLLIIVRYLNSQLVDFIKKFKTKLRIFYFMDDDLWDLKVLKYLPLKYAFKIYKHALKYKKLLLKLGARLIVSNEVLAEKYSKYQPQIIYPYPVKEPPETFNNTSKPRIFFYHATASHDKEFTWLSCIIKNLPDLSFELIADGKFVKLFKNFKNCYIINPMPWEMYQAFLDLRYRQVGIAFQLKNPFNKARSYVKFFNILQTGAVGIYSETFPESSKIKDFQAGFVLPVNEETWIKGLKTIAHLSVNELKTVYSNSLKLLESFKKRAVESYVSFKI